MTHLLRKRWFPWVLTLIVLAVWGLVIGLRSRSDLKPLTTEILSAAETTWKEKAPQAYEMDVVVSGVQQGRHHIVVANGKVTSMTTDGKPVPEHTWVYWTVDGMYLFIKDEMAMREHPETAFQTGEAKDVYLAVAFDPALGYPSHYLRQVFARKLTIEWQVENFHSR